MIFNTFLNKNLSLNILLKNSSYYIIIFNKNFFVKYKISKNNNIFFNTHGFSLNIKFKQIKLNMIKSVEFVNKLNYSLNNYFLKKITFTGKSYKIKKKTKCLYMIFNKSHKEVLTWKNIFLKKLRKTKLLIKSSNSSLLNNISNRILYVRKVNIFNKKGLKISKSIKYKKRGKKSS